MAKSSDREILEEAILRKATILTFDSDFHTILAFLSSTEVSVIRIRIEGLKGAQIARLVHEVLVSCEPDIAQGAAVTVTERGIRLRRLPLV